MTVQQLIEQLRDFDPLLEVFITSPDGECLEPIRSMADIIEGDFCVSISTNVAGEGDESK